MGVIDPFITGCENSVTVPSKNEGNVLICSVTLKICVLLFYSIFTVTEQARIFISFIDLFRKQRLTAEFINCKNTMNKQQKLGLIPTS